MVFLCAAPHQAPWWREGVALEWWMCAAQENGQQRRRSCSQTVTGDHQRILLHTSTREPFIQLLTLPRDGESAAEPLSPVRCWTPDSGSHRSLVSCRCNVQLDKCPAIERHASKRWERESMLHNWCFDGFNAETDLVSVAGSWNTFHTQILTFSGEIRQHVLQTQTQSTPLRLKLNDSFPFSQ